MRRRPRRRWWQKEKSSRDQSDQNRKHPSYLLAQEGMATVAAAL